MKQILLSFLLIAAASMCLPAQQQTDKTPPQFTKAEFLAFSDLKSLLSAINTGQDYSKYMVRNFNLTTATINPDGTATILSEMGPN